MFDLLGAPGRIFLGACCMELGSGRLGVTRLTVEAKKLETP